MALVSRSFATRTGRLVRWIPVREATAASRWASLVLLLVVPSVLVAQQPPDPIPAPAGVATRPDQVVGSWAYNSEDSRNIATGRPERGARGSAAPRPVAPRAAPTGRGGAGTDDDRVSPFAPSPLVLLENRDLSRDLLEIAETLTFSVAADAVTITDDLQRERTYPTDNRRQRYRLGASEFFARVRWEDGRLRRDIEGTFGFRMTETYYLSPDANRLFLIIRVGESSRGRPQAGVDRVYDRISPEEQ